MALRIESLLVTMAEDLSLVPGVCMIEKKTKKKTSLDLLAHTVT